MELIRLPETKLNELAQGVSQRLIEAYDFDDGKIGGEELKSFAFHNQINKFLIFQVFQVWDMQINKLNHPYFNLEDDDIQATLTTLKNQISQHIEIKKDDFRPMLERAVYNNLKLLLTPKDAFSSFFFANHDEIPLEVYQRYSQFFSDLDFVVNSILKFYQKNDVPSVEKAVFFQKMDKVLEIFDKKSEKDFATYRSEIFEKLTQHSIGDIQEEIEVERRWQLQQEEEARQKELEEQKKAEEEKRKAEEEARRLEEEARRKEEEEARRKAEEARLKEEEEARKKEAEKLSFFDTIEEEDDSFIDLDLEEEILDEEEESSVEEMEVPAEVEAEEIEVEEEVEVKVEETPVEPVEEPAVEEVVSEPVEEVLKEEIAEVIDEVTEEKDEFLEMAASMEPVEKVDEVVEKAEEVVEKEVKPLIEKVSIKKPQEAVSEIVEETVEAVEEGVEAPLAKAEEVITEVIDTTEESSWEESAQPEEETSPEPIEEEDEQESTVSFLDRFLSKKTPDAAPSANNGNGNTETSPVTREVEKPASVLDRLTERPQTVADQISQQKQQTPAVHQSINGSRKIKLDEIPIHKQYQYVQKVFEGNNVRFRIIVDKVNNAKNKEEVEDILSKFVLSNDAIDTSDAVVGEFIELLRNRF